MPKPQDALEQFANRLFYNENSSRLGFSYTPSNTIYFKNLLAGDPFFNQNLPGNGDNRRKKILIFSPSHNQTINHYSAELETLNWSIYVLSKLANFYCFCFTTNTTEIRALNELPYHAAGLALLSQDKTKQPTEQDISQFFPNKPRDEIYIVTAADIQLLMTEYLSQFMLLAPCEKMTIESYNISYWKKDSLSFENSQKLIQLSPHIRQLTLHDVVFDNEINDQQQNEFFKKFFTNAINLESIEIIPSNSLCLPINVIIEHLPETIKSVSLRIGNDSHLNALKDTNPDQLKKVTSLRVDYLQENIELLNDILRSTSNLKKLYWYLHFQDLDISSLPKQIEILECPNYNRANITHEKLDKIISRASKLREISLNNIEGNAFNNAKLSTLEKISIRNCYNPIPLNLNDLFCNATQLENISVMDSNFLTENFSLTHDLPSLKTIYFYRCDITHSMLIDLLKHTPNLVSIKLDNYLQNINPDFYNLSLPDLKIALGLVKHEASANKDILANEYYSVDANTAPNKPTYNLTRLFVGKPYLPDEISLRKQAYSELELNPNGTLHNAFLLKPIDKHSLLKKSIPSSPSSLKEIFEKNEPAAGRAQYLGVFFLQINSDWSVLPSLHSEETITQFYCDSTDIHLEFSYDAENHFYYVRASNPTKNQPIQLEILVDAPLNPTSILSLPVDIQNLIKDCQNYRSSALPSANYSSGKAYLDGILKMRVGACRHRSVTFKYLMQQRFPQYKVNIIRNDCHMFVEIYNPTTQSWINVDLGGYEAERKYNNTPFTGVYYTQHTKPNDDPTKTTQQTFSTRGTHTHSAEYYAKINNLSALSLEGSLDLPATLNITNVLTLTITNINFTHAALDELLRKIPNLETLKLNHVTLINNFDDLDFNFLSKLDWVELNGEFIPSNKALETLKVKHDKKIIWKASGPNVIQEVTETAAIKPDVIDTQIKVVNTQNKTTAPLRAISPIKNQCTLQSILNTDIHQTRLLTTNHPSDLSFQLLKLCHDTHKPVFLVDDPDQLKCQRPFIQRNGNIGSIQSGPGGDLYRFIEANPDGILLIDYSRFKDKDFVQSNSATDEQAKIDGIRFYGKVIGIINPDSPDAYNGADFYSRFKEVLPFEMNPLPSLESRVITDLLMDDITEYIDFAGDSDFKSILFGQWDIEGNQLFYREGRLSEVLDHHPQQILLKNAPLTDPAFIRFVREFEISHPAGPVLAFYQGIALDDFVLRVNLLRDNKLADGALCLNTATLSDFLGTYEASTGNLYKKLGYIASKKLPSLYLTESLRPNQWRQLLDCAKQHGQILNIQCAPNVTLPDELTSEPTRVKVTVEHLPRHISFMLHEPTTLSESSEMIDVSELTVSDLFDSIDATFDKDKLRFHFASKESYLKQALSTGKTILLKGKWPNELVQRFYAYFIDKQHESVTGKLIIVASDPNVFSCMQLDNDNKNQTYLMPSLAPEKVGYTYRFTKVSAALQHERFVFLQGPTGVGKTHFIEHEWSAHHDVFYGEDAILDWLNAMVSDDRYATLFIDEANITHQQWSLFEGLFNPLNPGVFYKGQFYSVTSQHKIIFAGNPFSYGGERTRPKLFNHAHAILEFDFIPIEVTLNESACDDDIKQLITLFANEIQSAYPNQLILTPREYIMMARLMQLLKHEFAQTMSLGEIFLRVKSAILKNHLPTIVDARFHLTDAPLPLLSSVNLIKGFVVTPNIEPAVSALMCHLALRKTRIEQPTTAPIGLGGLILEGSPGIGKSDVLIKTLVANQLKEKVDFYHIPVSLEYDEKVKQLLTAFHAGKIVIIDEINSSPMLERLLNALLEGHDLDGKPAEIPGFLLLGTQNPITFRGRRETTLPLKHRLQHVKLHDYAMTEMVDILETQYNLPRKIAISMAEELKKQQAQNPKLCFRDVLRWAQHWQTRSARMTPSTVPLTALPQIGSTCKVVALGNVERYFAEQLEFETIPVHKHKQTPLSLRQLAKAQGSLQGEILSFEKWESLTQTLGYKTETVNFGMSFEIFIDTLYQALKQGNLPMIAFAVDRSSGQPDINPSNPEDVEHAAVITGFDPHNEVVTLSHWGQKFNVDAGALFHSNLSLTEKRQSEYYRKRDKDDAITEEVQNSLHFSIFSRQKYIATTADNKNAMEANSHANGTGFKSKLLIVKNPTNHLATFLADRNEKIALTLFPKMLDRDDNNNNYPRNPPTKKRK